MRTTTLIILFTLILLMGCTSQENDQKDTKENREESIQSDSLTQKNLNTNSESTQSPSEIKELSNILGKDAIQQTTFECEVDEVPVKELEALGKSNSLLESQTSDPEPVDEIDAKVTMLVVYTSKAKEKLKNADNLIKAVRNAEQLTNDVLGLGGSGADVTLEVVAIEEIPDFTEVSMKEDLNALPTKQKGKKVRELREKYHADLVCLIRSTGGGRAYILNQNSIRNHSESAFMTIGSNCIDTGYLCFTHELGHLFGCAHDIKNANRKGLYDYSYGWHFKDPDNPGKTLGTIMSYPGAENREVFTSFSNPNIAYNGTPVGSDKANNLLTIRQTRKMIEAYRK